MPAPTALISTSAHKQATVEDYFSDSGEDVDRPATASEDLPAVVVAQTLTSKSTTEQSASSGEHLPPQRRRSLRRPPPKQRPTLIHASHTRPQQSRRPSTYPGRPTEPIATRSEPAHHSLPSSNDYQSPGFYRTQAGIIIQPAVTRRQKQALYDYHIPLRAYYMPPPVSQAERSESDRRLAGYYSQNPRERPVYSLPRVRDWKDWGSAESRSDKIHNQSHSDENPVSNALDRETQSSKVSSSSQPTSISLPGARVVTERPRSYYDELRQGYDRTPEGRRRTGQHEYDIQRRLPRLRRVSDDVSRLTQESDEDRQERALRSSRRQVDLSEKSDKAQSRQYNTRAKVVIHGPLKRASSPTSSTLESKKYETNLGLPRLQIGSPDTMQAEISEDANNCDPRIGAGQLLHPSVGLGCTGAAETIPAVERSTQDLRNDLVIRQVVKSSSLRPDNIKESGLTSENESETKPYVVAEPSAGTYGLDNTFDPPFTEISLNSARLHKIHRPIEDALRSMTPQSVISNIWMSDEEDMSEEVMAQSSLDSDFHVEPASDKDDIFKSQSRLPSMHQRRSTRAVQLRSLHDSFESSDDDCGSSIPSYAASIFTIDSLASSASALSNKGPYSDQQIATATRKLVVIVSEDALLLPLYQNAIRNPDIGRERLERNLRRLFKVYADNLEEEGEGRIEFLASRLVAIKARYLARYIVEKLQPHASRQQSHLPEQQEESSDEDEKANAINDDMFEDLEVFGDFLAKSSAFATLQAQVQHFVLPKVLLLDPHNPLKSRVPQNVTYNTEKTRTWETWLGDAKCVADAVFLDPADTLLSKRALFLIIDTFYLATDALAIRLGALEPPLAQNATRLRWQSKSGEHIFNDVVEHVDGGIEHILPRLERSSGTRVTAATYNGQTGNQQYIAPRPVQWVRNGFAKLSTNASARSRAAPCIPLHNAPGSSTSTTAPASPPTSRSVLHLLACMHRDNSRKILQQDLLEDVGTDRELFTFMRRQYTRHRGRIRSMLSFKSVQGIFFVKFNLPIGKSVIVRDHNSYCTASAPSMSCECIPPAAIVEPAQNAQYRCIPGPPVVYPPIPSEHLRLLFLHPEDADETDDWILKQLPKRICGKLQGQAGQPAEGWGVYYQEGWDRDLISVMIFSLFLVASALFGALWSVFKFDIQGAFGISAYMVAVCAALIPLIAMGVDRPR